MASAPDGALLSISYQDGQTVLKTVIVESNELNSNFNNRFYSEEFLINISKPGYNFLGWKIYSFNGSYSGSQQILKPGVIIFDICYNLTGFEDSLILQGVWEPVSNKILQTRIQQKTDTTANWENIGSTFTPLRGEFILYNDTYRIKIGDGSTVLNELKYIDEIYQGNWNQIDQNAPDYIKNKPCGWEYVEDSITLTKDIINNSQWFTLENIGTIIKISNDFFIPEQCKIKVPSGEEISLNVEYIPSEGGNIVCWIGLENETFMIGLSHSYKEAPTGMYIFGDGMNLILETDILFSYSGVKLNKIKKQLLPDFQELFHSKSFDFVEDYFKTLFTFYNDKEDLTTYLDVQYNLEFYQQGEKYKINNKECYSISFLDENNEEIWLLTNDVYNFIAQNYTGDFIAFTKQAGFQGVTIIVNGRGDYCVSKEKIPVNKIPKEASPWNMDPYYLENIENPMDYSGSIISKISSGRAVYIEKSRILDGYKDIDFDQLSYLLGIKHPEFSHDPVRKCVGIKAFASGSSNIIGPSGNRVTEYPITAPYAVGQLDELIIDCGSSTVNIFN